MKRTVKQGINDKDSQMVLTQLRTELGFFMEFMWETIKLLILWNISNESFEERYKFAKLWAQEYSQKIDESYQRGDFGRLWIMEWGPDYARSFEEDKNRCLEILEFWGVRI